MLMRCLPVVLLTIAIMLAGGADPLVAQESTSSAEHQNHAQHRGETVTLFPTKEVSGTAWVPDLTPMYGWHSRAGGWDVMAHGNVFVQFLYESGEIHRRGH